MDEFEKGLLLLWTSRDALHPRGNVIAVSVQEKLRHHIGVVFVRWIPKGWDTFIARTYPYL